MAEILPLCLQAATMINLTKGRPDREGAFDLFTYHMYCNQLGGAECGVVTQSVVALGLSTTELAS